MAINSVTLSGRLTRTPELKILKANETEKTEICKFTIAVDDFVKGKEVTYFVDCTCFNKKAEYVNNYISKGDLVCVKGKLTINKFETREGQTRYYTDILLDDVVGFKSKSDDAPANNTSVANTEEVNLDDDLKYDYNPDDLPF